MNFTQLLGAIDAFPMGRYILPRRFVAMACFGIGVVSAIGSSSVETLARRAREEIKEGLTYAGSWHEGGDSWCFEDPAFMESDQDFEFVELRGLTYEVKTIKAAKTDRLNGFGWVAQVTFDSTQYRVQRYRSQNQSELSAWASSKESHDDSDRPALLKLFQGGPRTWIVVAEKNGVLEWYQCDGHEPDLSRSYSSFYDVIRDRAWHQNTREINSILARLVRTFSPDFHQRNLHDTTVVVRNDALPNGRLVIRDFVFDVDASALPPKHLGPKLGWYYFAKIIFSNKEVVSDLESAPEMRSLIPSELTLPLYVGARIGVLEWYDSEGNSIVPNEYFAVDKLGFQETKK